jgi:prevent-host-death family protein
MPKIILSKDVMSVTDFARGTKELLADLSRHQRPRVLTQNGKAAAVVMSVEAYEAMAQDAEEHRLDVQLKAAMEAYSKGERGRPLDEVVPRASTLAG